MELYMDEYTPDGELIFAIYIELVGETIYYYKKDASGNLLEQWEEPVPPPAPLTEVEQMKQLLADLTEVVLLGGGE